MHFQAASDRHIDPDHFCAVCSIKGKVILIIGNVITSGAKLRAAAAALKGGGAEVGSNGEGPLIAGVENADIKNS